MDILIQKGTTYIIVPSFLLNLIHYHFRQNNTMIGYLFTKGELNDRKYSQRRSSVSALLERTNLTAEEILFGETSLGNFPFQYLMYY